MNMILFSTHDVVGEDCISIRDSRRLTHITQIHRATLGSTLNVGLVNGQMGTGVVTKQTADEIQLHISLTRNPPDALPATLVLALPRPKMLKRTLQTIATLGIKKCFLINSYRVEKSYWQTPLLEPDAIREHLTLGLEQACDTLIPEITLIKRFKPFVEDQLKEIVGDTRALVAHPYTATPCPAQIDYPITLAIGPEGGFIDYEIELLKLQGFAPVSLGERIMRVETVVPYLLGRLY